MSVAVVYSRAASSLRAPQITVEAHLANGLPSFTIVGLPEKVVKESKDRVRSAILNCQFEFPMQRVTVNLAPADIPKDTTCYDLPIAIGILAATQQIPPLTLAELEFAGELALTGELRAIRGCLPFALACQQANRSLVIPAVNQTEASVISDLTILPAKHLLEITQHLQQVKTITPLSISQPHYQPTDFKIDLNQVIGQSHAKRGLLIAACGQHNALLYGPPGSGKTLLIHCLPALLPPLSPPAAIDVMCLRSLAGLNTTEQDPQTPPFRTPHHSASQVALIGGGRPIKPGEISLAHHGILFLDELPEFSRAALESLRQPLESGEIHISRSGQQATFPAKFQLLAAMNPCPCGYYGDAHKICRCSAKTVLNYQQKLSGPLLDRFDIYAQTYTQSQFSKPTKTLHKASDFTSMVADCQQQQYQRQQCLNNQLMISQLIEICQLSSANQTLLEQAIIKYGLSIRATHRCLRVARTIADMAACEIIQKKHLLEALSYRQLQFATLQV